MGIDCEIFLQKPSDKYICPICFEVFKDCYITPCFHHYCRDCLVSLTNTEDSLCAIDLQKINFEDCQVDENINTTISLMEVECNNCCTWKGKLIDLKNHQRKECKKSMYKKTKWINGLIGGSKEISLRIISFLNVEDIMVIMLVNKNWNKLANNKYLWRHLYKLQFGSIKKHEKNLGLVL